MMEVKERQEILANDTPGETTEGVSATEHEVHEDLLNVMGFRLGNEEYAIDIMHIKEITIPSQLTPVPRAPHYILGILSLRGNIIPVFDAKQRIGLPEGKDMSRARILVIRHGDEQVGILVDAITGAAQLPTSSIEPPPPVLKGVEAEYISGVGRDGDRMIIIMNIDELFKVNSSESSSG
jgi:purine-binding chemotaxis protein CheW